MINKKLKDLALKLVIISASDASKQANNLADIMANKKRLVKDTKELFKILDEEDNFKIRIDSPKGSKKGFGDRDKIKKRTLPFDYGEILTLINPADNRPWDVIIPPSEDSDLSKIIPIGIIKYKDDKKLWKEKADKLPPKGNDKIIISKNGKILDDDKKIIEDFFEDMWQFEKIKWL